MGYRSGIAGGSKSTDYLSEICCDCPYFSVRTNHATSYDGGLHMIYISCEHRDLCNYLRKHIEKELIKND